MFFLYFTFTYHLSPDIGRSPEASILVTHKGHAESSQGVQPDIRKYHTVYFCLQQELKQLSSLSVHSYHVKGLFLQLSCVDCSDLQAALKLT